MLTLVYITPFILLQIAGKMLLKKLHIKKEFVLGLIGSILALLVTNYWFIHALHDKSVHMTIHFILILLFSLSGLIGTLQIKKDVKKAARFILIGAAGYLAVIVYYLFSMWVPLFFYGGDFGTDIFWFYLIYWGAIFIIQLPPFILLQIAGRSLLKK